MLVAKFSNSCSTSDPDFSLLKAKNNIFKNLKNTYGSKVSYDSKRLEKKNKSWLWILRKSNDMNILLWNSSLL
jgi:hypothetical protein